jgi:hypothetical protein
MEVRRCRNTSISNTEIRQATIKQLRRGETLPIVTMPLCSPMGRGRAGDPVQVRNHDGAGVQATEGAFMRSDLPIAGFAVIEAANVTEAIELASQTPCAVAHGVVEVWPLNE